MKTIVACLLVLSSTVSFGATNGAAKADCLSSNLSMALGFLPPDIRALIERNSSDHLGNIEITKVNQIISGSRYVWTDQEIGIVQTPFGPGLQSLNAVLRNDRSTAKIRNGLAVSKVGEATLFTDWIREDTEAHLRKFVQSGFSPAFNQEGKIKATQQTVFRILLPDTINKKYGLEIGKSTISFLGINKSAIPLELYHRLLGRGIIAISQNTFEDIVHDSDHAEGFWILSHHPFWEDCKVIFNRAFGIIDDSESGDHAKRLAQDTMGKMAGHLETLTQQLSYPNFVHGVTTASQIESYNAGSFGSLKQVLQSAEHQLGQAEHAQAANHARINHR